MSRAMQRSVLTEERQLNEPGQTRFWLKIIVVKRAGAITRGSSPEGPRCAAATDGRFQGG